MFCAFFPKRKLTISPRRNTLPQWSKQRAASPSSSKKPIRASPPLYLTWPAASLQATNKGKRPLSSIPVVVTKDDDVLNLRRPSAGASDCLNHDGQLVQGGIAGKNGKATCGNRDSFGGG